MGAVRAEDEVIKTAVARVRQFPADAEVGGAAVVVLPARRRSSDGVEHRLEGAHDDHVVEHLTMPFSP